MRLIKVVAMLALSVLGSALAASAGAAADQRQVLPDSVVPIHYDLTVSPDAAAQVFRGKVAITVDVRTATASVVLNAVGLTFEHATLDGGADATVAIDTRLGRATLGLSAPVTPGRHVISIDYHGQIGRSTLGFFAMNYSSPAGERRTLATNFEPAAARELLPCWDEPGRKATFTVTVDAPRDRMALSNMPVAGVTPLSPTLQRVRFAETPRMSTYLLFLGVGDFERIHQAVDGVDVGVVVKRGDTAKAAYALDQAAKLLHYYNQYFGVPFPLPKLDLIAAPGEISGGSMENWGAIFYSQHHVLFDPAVSTEADRQLVFLVVSHEMAHQWFGDLVTMAWWDNLWLNEGFARWMQTFAADDLHPEWETGLRAASIFESGKEADSVPSTHPVVQDVLTAEQAGQSFDSITYAKGAAIITMINAYVGRDRFREGVRLYMRAHALGNTVDNDLWTIMQQAVGKPVVEIEREFTRQEGVPLVQVTGTPKGVHLAQARFADDPSTIKGIPAQRWHLPLAVASLDGSKRDILLYGMTDLAQARPLLVNAGQMGFARVLYSHDLLDGLAIHMGALAPADQMGLLNDALALGVAGYSPAHTVLSLAAALPADANPIVWQRVIRILSNLEIQYADAGARRAFHRFALGLLAPVAARLGSAGSPREPSNIVILRGALAEAQGDFGDAGAMAVARKRLRNRQGTPAEQRSALSIVATQADPSTFDNLLARAAKTSDPLAKLHVYEALADVSDPALARRMIDIALSDKVPAGSAPELISILARRHPDAVWKVVAPRLDDSTLPLDTTLRWELASTIAGFSADPQRVVELEAYEARSVPVESRKPFLAATAAIQRNQRFATAVLPDIDRWIAARQLAPSH